MTRLRMLRRSHPILMLLGAFVLVAGGGATFAAVSMRNDFAPVAVDYSVPVAPTLQPASDSQTVYRIDASRSTVAYEVTEKLAGTEHTARGTTSGIAGDVLVDAADPANSTVGEVVVNVLQFTSDQSLRDNRIRHEFLQSEKYPLAHFTTTSIDGLPGTIADGTDYDVHLDGDLTVKETTAPVTLDATVRRDGDELHITATSTVSLSTFDIGPMRIVGLVSTGDEAVLRFDLVAVDAAKHQVPRTVNGPTNEIASGGPSFAETVQPILERSCASCHEPSGSGSGEWQLATAADAADAASGLALVTQTRYMPPWPASDRGVPLLHSMRLPDADIAAIKAWADAGGPLDVDPTSPVTATPQEVDAPRHDLELRMAEPYQGSQDIPNDYRCFVLDPHLTAPAVVTGYEFEPDQVELVHHTLVYRLHASAADAIAQADDRDPGPGWQCFGGINVRGADPSASGGGGGSDLVMGYAPGQTPTTYADGTGLILDPGDLLVMQMHYHITHPSEPDRSAIALQLGAGPVTSYDPVEVTTFLAPAEIPCGPDESGPLCDRDAELRELDRLYGGVGPAIANGLHFLCGTTPEQLGVLDADLVAHSSCDHRIGRSGQLLAVLGHMHEIGRSFRMTLNPGTPQEQILLDIPRWDFDWQFNYPLVDPIELHAGDTIRIECSWDRHLVEQDQPHYVTWAEGTEDEMCFSTISVRYRR